MQQVLQQIQHNPDPRVIENLAEILHRAKVESLEHELQAQYSHESKRIKDRLRTVAHEERQMYQRECINAVLQEEHGSEATVQRLREELSLAQMSRMTSRANATEADHRMAEFYPEAQVAIQKIQSESAQQKLLTQTELQSSQQKFAIQGAKLQSHVKELAEQRWLVEKQAGELKEQQRMLNEQRIMFQEQTGQTRVLMNDCRSQKDEFEGRHPKL